MPMLELPEGLTGDAAADEKAVAEARRVLDDKASGPQAREAARMWLHKAELLERKLTWVVVVQVRYTPSYHYPIIALIVE